MLFICHPGCSTCKKARDFLTAHGLAFTQRDIRTQNPNMDELKAWHRISGLPLRRFFNTSGLAYRALGLSARLDSLSEDEQLALLAQDGMLVRRPLLVLDQQVLVGFQEKAWSQALTGK